MKMLQITIKALPNFDQECWFDVCKLPAVNDLKELLEQTRKDFPGRKVRIIEILEE